MDHIRCPNGGKVAYGTRADAVQAKRRVDCANARNGRQVDNNLRVYECVYCRLWHVGHDKLIPRRN